MASVLVVDDRAENRELLAVVLASADHRVLEAATGRDALAVARQEAPDLVIADILMPGMDGYELVRALRAEAGTARTRVVLCTATYDESEVRRLAEALGVLHVLIKPVEPEHVLAVVAEALGQEAAPAGAGPAPAQRFEEDHLRSVNDKLLQKILELEHLNQEHAALERTLRAAERETAESLTLLETLQSTAPVSFAFVDTELRLRRLNAAAAGVIGRPAEDLIGLPLAEALPQTWTQAEAAYRRVLDSGEPVLNQQIDRPPADPGGRGETYLSSYYPVRLHGELIGVGVVAVSITERREAEEFRQAVMDNMAEGLYVVDAADRLTYMNAAACRMLGYEESELRGRRTHELIHHQRADGTPLAADECELRTVRRDGVPVRRPDDAFTRKDGTIMPAAFSAAPLGTGAAGYGAIVVFRDTTAERAEQARARRELDALTWVGRIRDALDEGRMVLHSQPIVALGGGRGSQELLIRMLGSDGKLIAPGSFLPVAEKYGLIGDVDDWVIGQAMRIAARGEHVHVNVSADSISNVDLVPLIERELAASGADPKDVVFEITETALMVDVEAGESFARRLAALGCGLALDNFGTGYGSFTYLKRLPMRHLKIDIEFVRDLPSNVPNQHLVKAIVSIAKGFGLATIAEGVEDAETLELLRSYDVDFAQGFHIGRPVPVVEPSRNGTSAPSTVG